VLVAGGLIYAKQFALQVNLRHCRYLCALYKRTFPGQLMASVTELKHGVKFNT